jgi:hypothetical protein
MKKTHTFAPLLAIGSTALLAIALAAGCGSSSSGDGSGGGGGGGFGCTQGMAGSQFCSSYTGLTADQKNSAEQACTNGGGMVVASCPTAGLVGCCKLTVMGIVFSECYYFGMAANDQSACTMGGGTWSTTM